MGCCALRRAADAPKNDSPIIDMSKPPFEAANDVEACPYQKAAGTKPKEVTTPKPKEIPKAKEAPKPKETKVKPEEVKDGYIQKKNEGVVFQTMDISSMPAVSKNAQHMKSWWERDEEDDPVVESMLESSITIKGKKEEEISTSPKFSTPMAKPAGTVDDITGFRSPLPVHVQLNEEDESPEPDKRDIISSPFDKHKDYDDIEEFDIPKPKTGRVNKQPFKYEHLQEDTPIDRPEEKYNVDNDSGPEEDLQVKVDDEYGYIHPTFGRNVDSSPEELGSTKEFVIKAKPDEDVNVWEISATNDEENGRADNLIPEAKPIYKPLQRRAVRPMPLKRGTRPVVGRRRAEPLKPTPATVSSLIDKMVKLDESKWREQIKCQNELSDIAQKHPDVIKQCNPDTLVTAVRAISAQANSGRSNVSNGGLNLLGVIYKACGPLLNPVLGNVLDVCTRKAASGSPEFICNSANAALAKICLYSSEVKLSLLLVHKHKENKSSQLITLNCIILLLDRIGSSQLEKLKNLGDIITIALSALSAGSLQLRTAGRLVLGMINEHVSVADLIKKLRKGDDALRLANASMKRYKESDKVLYIQKLKQEVV